MPPNSINTKALWQGFWNNRSLIIKLTRREVIGRYRGSVLGVIWSFLNPIFMLTIYTLVFSVVFKARWNAQMNSHADFALALFSGLMIFNVFSECITRAPSLIIQNANYVKKVVFPLEVLPWVSMGVSLTHFAISFVVWLVFYTALSGLPGPQIIFVPFLVIPFIFTTMGFSWFLASLGVYVRDVTHLIGFVTTALLFLTPIFYPVSSLPDSYQTVIFLNPLTIFVEAFRKILLEQQLPPLYQTTLLWLGSWTIMQLGFAWFQKTRKGFADVV